MPPPDHASQLLNALQKHWGYSTFRPLQQEIMTAVLGGRDTLTVLPTGGGKSLCYQAPALCHEGVAVVVSPLISLMKDQVDALQNCGVAAGVLNSTQSGEEQHATMRQVQSGELKLLYVSPERLVQASCLQQLQRANIAFFAIDEAHCVSQWGHDFRPPYRQLARLRQSFPNARLHALTATATPRVQADIIDQLQLEQPGIFVGNFDRPNLRYRAVRRDTLGDQLLAIIKRHPREAGIIYCITRKEVDRWAASLMGYGIRARAYHAGLSDDERRDNQDAFLRDECDVMVATVAFGMGIDKSNVRYVIHAGLPQSLEHYQQESGRAGRDGLEADCVLIHGGGDIRMWQQLFSDQPPELQQQSLKSLQAVVDYCEAPSCRRQQLVRHFGQDLPDHCGGHCDMCSADLQLQPDALIVAQKILSSVYRQGQRFGSEYTAAVLRGSREGRILQNQHDQLSTWGLLKEFPQSAIQDWIGQLAQQKYLAREGEFNTLKITPLGQRLLKGELTPRLLQPAPKATATASESSGRSTARAEEYWEGVDTPLFEVLREWRLGVSQERNLPAYTILHDAALRELARSRPVDLQHLKAISGIGERKLADFGDDLCRLISSHCEHSQLSTNVAVPAQARPRTSSLPAANSVACFPAFERGESIEAVMTSSGRARSTVVNYLCDYLRAGHQQELSKWVTPAVTRRVQAKLPEFGPGMLKPLFLALNEEVDYDSLKLVCACWEGEK